MAWVDEWGLLLSAIDGMFHNMEQNLKAPFREKLRQKYAKKYNEESLISDFTMDTRDIFLFSRLYDHISAGNGLFILHLMNEYNKQGKQVKIIMAGTKRDVASYFERELGYSITEIDAKDENYESIFEKSIHNFENVITISDSMSYSREYDKKPSFFVDIMKKISLLPKDDKVIYLVTSLFVHNKKSKKSLLDLSSEKNIRLIHFELDLPKLKKSMSENDINLFFPHYGDRGDSKNIYEQLENAFSSIPSRMFKKTYWAYYHFIYQKDGKEGIFFMDKLEKPDR